MKPMATFTESDLDNIHDVILQEDGAFKAYKVVLKQEPVFKYRKTMSNLDAVDKGFASSFYHQRPQPGWEAFAGREVRFTLEDGNIEIGRGQWWAGSPIGRWKAVGYAAIDKLEECYVFYGGWICTDLLDEWLARHVPKTDYHFYQRRRKA